MKSSITKNLWLFVTVMIVIQICLLLLDNTESTISQSEAPSKNSPVLKVPDNPPVKPIPNPVLQPCQESYLKSTGTTVVTGMWFLPHSKHSDSQYKAWIENFLSKVTGNLVIFGDTSLRDLLKESLSKRSNVIIKDDYPSPFHVPCVQLFEVEYRQRQPSIDPESYIHSPELYAVWNAKSCLVDQVSRENPFNSRYFLWVDIGSLRQSNFRFTSWPSEKRVSLMFSETTPSNHEIIFGLINPISVQEFKRVSRSREFPRGDFVEGTFFGGTQCSINKYMNVFWKLHNELLSKGKFVGKDQNLMNMIVFAELVDNIKILPSYKFNGGSCDDVWFYFYQFLADDEQREIGCSLVTMNKVIDNIQR